MGIIDILLNCKNFECKHRPQFPHNCTKCYRIKPVTGRLQSKKPNISNTPKSIGEK